MGTRNLPPRAWVFGNESDSSLQDLSLYSILSDIDLTESLQKPTEADKELQVEADLQAGIDESEEVGENKEGFPEDKTEDVDSLHQITFTSPAVPSVLSAQDLIDFHTVQVEKGEGESVESLKSAAVESYLDTVRSLNKVNKRVSFGGVEERQIRNDSPDEGEKIEEGNLFENPLYESLTECLSGLVGQYDEPLNLPVYHNEQPEHLYQNNEPVYQNEHLHEHLYENEIFGDAESSTDEPIYENIEFHNEVSNCQPPSPTKADTNPFRAYNGSVEEEQSSISSTPSSLTPPQNPSPPPLNPFLPTETREDPEGKEGDSPHYSPRASLQMATSGVEFEKSLLKLNPTTGKPSAAAPLEEELQETGDDDLLAQGFKKTQIIEIFDDGSWDSKEMPEELNGVEEVSVAAATNYSVSAATAETPTVVRTDGVYMAACVTITDMNDNNQTSDAVSKVQKHNEKPRQASISTEIIRQYMELKIERENERKRRVSKKSLDLGVQGLVGLWEKPGGPPKGIDDILENNFRGKENHGTKDLLEVTETKMRTRYSSEMLDLEVQQYLEKGEVIEASKRNISPHLWIESDSDFDSDNSSGSKENSKRGFYAITGTAADYDSSSEEDERYQDIDNKELDSETDSSTQREVDLTANVGSKTFLEYCIDSENDYTTEERESYVGSEVTDEILIVISSASPRGSIAEVTSTIPPPPPPPVQPLQKVEPIFSAKPATVVEEIPQKQKNVIKAPQRKKKSGHKKEAKKSSTEKPTNTPESVEKMVEDIEKERKKLIGEQVIRAKKMESWLKSDKKQTVVQNVDAKTLESKKKYEARKKQKEKENVQQEGENSGKTHQKKGKKGEVNLDSIIKHKDATKSFWETKMLAAVTKPEEEEEVPKTNGYHSVEDAIQPPPQFNSSNASDGNSSDEELGGGGKALTKYIYGDRGELIEKSISTRKEAVIVEAQKPASQENIIEQEIREQQLREAHMRNEIMLKDEEDRSDEEDLQDVLNPQESVIEREIRLQRERERKLSQEREEARRAAIDRTGLAMIEPLSNGYASQSSPSPPPSDSGDFPASAEARIALEIRELKAREEELRRARDRELGVEEAPVSFTASTTTDEGNYSECGHDDSGSSRLTSPEVPTVSSHQRTQSLDSISSGHSSSGTAHSYAEFVSKRKVTVRPLAEPEDEEETPAYRRVLGETAVEREIRVSMEREEELKKMRRNSLTSTPIKKELSRRPSTGKLDSAPDSRDVPHRLATLSIRRELWEQSEREQSLRQEGTIRTTSEDYVDAKVTRLSDLVEMSKEQINEQTMKMVGATPPTTPSPQPQFTRTPVFRKASAPSSLTNGHSPVQVTPVRVSTSVAPTRGIMQKFIANRGKIPAISAFNAAPSGTSTLPPRVPPVNNSVSPPVTSSATLKPTPAKKFEKNKTSSRTLRRYSTAEEKIHQELKDMKQREQELRYHRKQVLARSQPDLLAALNDEQIPEVEETDEEVCLPSLKPLRDRAMSNPNLLDEVECDSVKPAVRAAAPRRNPLIAKWESRIQQNIES